MRSPSPGPVRRRLEHLSIEHAARLRAFAARRGHERAAAELKTSTDTVAQIIGGGDVTPKTKRRLEAALDALVAP